MKVRLGTPEDEGGRKMKRLFSGKVLTYLLTIATLGLMLGANMKWHG